MSGCWGGVPSPRSLRLGRKAKQDARKSAAALWYPAGVLRHDFIKRLIEKMAAFMARLAGLAAQGKLDEADGEIQAIERELGLPRGYERLDTRSIGLLLGHAESLINVSSSFELRSMKNDLVYRRPIAGEEVVDPWHQVAEAAASSASERGRDE